MSPDTTSESANATDMFGPIVDVAFRLNGEPLPLDHGYALYSAVSAALPRLHGARWLGIHPVDGKPVGRGGLALGQNSALKLRVPAERIPELLRLAGRTLVVSGCVVRIGPPTVLPLVPAASLDARCVHVRLTRPPRTGQAETGRLTLDMGAMKAATLQELKRQLAAQSVKGEVELCGRRTISIGKQRLVGFSVRVSALDAEASLALQARGLGGKRAMGCGIFRPTMARKRAADG